MPNGRSPNKEELLSRIRELESQLQSQESMQALVESLHVHQEELRSQQETLVDAQVALEHSRDRYAELYDFAPLPIISLASNGSIEAMNLAAARMLGVDRANSDRMPMVVYVDPDSRRRFLDHMVRARREQGLVRDELVLRPRHRKPIPVEIQTKRFVPSSGDRLLFQTVLIDLTERRRAEEERRHASEDRDRSHREEAAARAASEAKDRFLAVLSHELRTPLTPILLTLETLEDDREGPSELRRSVSLIRRNTEVMARLIDDLLDVTRIIHDKLHLSLAPTALHALVRSAVEMCESDLANRHIQLAIALEPGDPFVLGDALRLRQIFWNLLKNAIQHTPDGGHVDIRGEMRGTQTARVSVTDSGAGFEPEDVERLFEPFQQAKKSKGAGLGLGLAICRGLAEAHGGTIHASSLGADSGATFVVELPTCPAPRSLPRSVIERPARRDPLRILVVEDHADTADAMQHVLSRLGYHVRVAQTLAEGRELAREPFDVLISDLQLPDGSGLDLMRELSARHPVHGIAMSGFGTEKDVRRSRDAGFHTHLVKPVDAHSVAEAIAALPRD